jgi:hypothetical protein
MVVTVVMVVVNRYERFDQYCGTEVYTSTNFLAGQPSTRKLLVTGKSCLPHPRTTVVTSKDNYDIEQEFFAF